MPVTYVRLVVGGVLTAAALAVPVAAFASGSGSPAAKPAHSSTTPHARRAKAEASKPAPSSTALKAKRAKAKAAESAATSQMHALASSAGISVSRLGTGLVAAKRAGGSSAARVAAFARAAGVSHATAQRIVSAVFGRQVDHSLTGPSAVAALAARLGVSTSAARHALQQVGSLSGRHGVDPASTAFSAIARQLGVSPARLAGALDAVKKSVAGR